jgi:iron(III) transport system substrate-binding protein
MVSGVENDIERRFTSERRAGKFLADVFMVGVLRSYDFMQAKFLDPIKPVLVLPEVVDESKWWQGKHHYSDPERRYLFRYVASAQYGQISYNTQLVQPKEFTSFWDFLQPKWKGKIGFFEPRVPSAGQGLWGFLMKNKGKEFLQKLAQQELVIHRDGQQLAVGLAKGTLAVALGLSQRFVDPYIKGGLPIKVLLALKEGLSGSNGFGTVAIMRNAPHSNAAKVYINWLLGKEGQDLYGRALTQGSRRLDVDTKWLAKFNTPAAKDVTTPEDFEKVRFYGEDIITEWRVPGGEFARKILK